MSALERVGAVVVALFGAIAATVGLAALGALWLLVRLRWPLVILAVALVFARVA